MGDNTREKGPFRRRPFRQPQSAKETAAAAAAGASSSEMTRRQQRRKKSSKIQLSPALTVRMLTCPMNRGRLLLLK